MRQGLDENLHAPTLTATGVATTTCASLSRVLETNAKTEDKRQSRLLLNVVIAESTLFSSCLPAKIRHCWSGGLLVLNLRLDVVDCVGGLHLQSYCLASECLDEYLHPTMETEDEMEDRILQSERVRPSSSSSCLPAKMRRC